MQEGALGRGEVPREQRCPPLPALPFLPLTGTKLSQMLNENGAVLGRMWPALVFLLRMGCAPGKFGTWGLWGFIQSTPDPSPHRPHSRGCRTRRLPPASAGIPTHSWCERLQGWDNGLARDFLKLWGGGEHQSCLTVSHYHSILTFVFPVSKPSTTAWEHCPPLQSAPTQSITVDAKQWRHPIIPPPFPNPPTGI